MAMLKPMQFDMTPDAAATSSGEARAAFITKTYLHLFGAIVAFVGIEFMLFATGLVAPITQLAFASKFSWLLFMGAFVGVSYLADRWARSDTSIPLQYAGLGLFILFEALIFAPLL